MADLRSVARLVTEEVAAAPACVVSASLRGRRGAGFAGRLSPAADAAATRAETVFDLASVTKPVVAITAARLAQRA